jgi:hypothetical protein
MISKRDRPDMTGQDRTDRIGLAGYGGGTGQAGKFRRDRAGGIRQMGQGRRDKTGRTGQA